MASLWLRILDFGLASFPHLCVVVADLSALQPRPAPCGCNPLVKQLSIRLSTMKLCKSLVIPKGEEAIESLSEL